MVAEVVLSVMGNRSDRRFPNLSCAWALEAVEVTRRKRADFHQGQERNRKAHSGPMAAIPWADRLSGSVALLSPHGK